MKLTERMHHALKQAKAGPLRRVHNPTLHGQPPWPAHPATLAALERHQLLERSQIKNRRGYPTDLWTITGAGRQALDPPARLKEDRPNFLGPGFPGPDYTTIRADAIDDVEIIDPDHIKLRWKTEASERHADAEDRRTAARRLARNARAA